MKTIFAAFALSFSFCTSYGQSCQEIKLADNRTKQYILKDYVTSCRLNNYFIEDKGIITIIVYQDAIGHTCWYLSSLIDDRFLKTPTTEYTQIDNDIGLIYKGNSLGRIIPQPAPINDAITCILEVISSRVYKYTTGQQYTYTTDANGKRERWRVVHEDNGNVHNDLIIIFNADGTFTKKIPA